MERKLASIQVVADIQPIVDSYFIEKLKILDWWVIVKKGTYEIGEKLVYVEIDSFIPNNNNPEYDFLRKQYYYAPVIISGKVFRPGGFRIKTIKLRGEIGQGVCFKLSILDNITTNAENIIGRNVTELLNIIKYEEPSILDYPVVNDKKTVYKVSQFPPFLTKTDETRVQLLGPLLESLKGVKFYFTEKIDGSSVSIYLKGNQLGVCSRNQKVENTAFPYSYLLKAYKIEEKLHNLRFLLMQRNNNNNLDLCIQGEMIGQKVQGNKYKLNNYDYYVFKLIVWEHGISTSNKKEKGYLYPLMDTQELLEKVGLKMVPFLGEIELNHTPDDLIKMAEGPSKLRAQTTREGLVFRPITPVCDSAFPSGHVSFKAISPSFLLKFDE